MGKRGRQQMTEEQKAASDADRIKYTARKVGCILDWLQSCSVKATVERYKAVIAVSVPAKIIQDEPPAEESDSAWKKKKARIYIYHDSTISAWYTAAVERMAKTACPLEEALFFTWPPSKTESAAEADPNEGMFEDAAKEDFAKVEEPSVETAVVPIADAGMTVESETVGDPIVKPFLPEPVTAPAAETAVAPPRKASSVIKVPKPQPKEDSGPERDGILCRESGCYKSAHYAIFTELGGPSLNMCKDHWRPHATPEATVWAIDEAGRAVRELTEQEKIDGN